MNKPRQALSEFMKRSDMLLFTLSLISAIIGIIIIASAAHSYDTPRYVLVQTASLFIGIGLFVVLTIIDIDIIADKWPLLMIFSTLLFVALLFFGEGDEVGSRSWLRAGPVGIQPSEVVRIIYIVVMAKHLSYLKEYKNLNSPISMAQLVLHFAFMFGLVIFVSSDLGSALIFLFIFVIMMFMAGIKIYWFIVGIAAVAAATPFIWSNVLRDYQKDRILAPYVQSIDPGGFDVRWQANQSRLALASGQLTGTGLYNGPQSQSNAIPEKHTDFIFAVIGEELGLIGCAVILILLILIIIRCVYIGIKSGNTMNMLTCFGVASMIFFQTFENIGMCMGITPVIGITLPFFSYGGSSLFSAFAAMGLVSGIKYRPKPERFRSY